MCFFQGRIKTNKPGSPFNGLSNMPNCQVRFDKLSEWIYDLSMLSIVLAGSGGIGSGKSILLPQMNSAHQEPKRLLVHVGKAVTLVLISRALPDKASVQVHVASCRWSSVNCPLFDEIKVVRWFCFPCKLFLCGRYKYRPKNTGLDTNMRKPWHEST